MNRLVSQKTVAPLLSISFTAVPVGSERADILVGVYIGPNFLAGAAHAQDGIVFISRHRGFLGVFTVIPIEKVVESLREFFSPRLDLPVPRLGEVARAKQTVGIIAELPKHPVLSRIGGNVSDVVQVDVNLHSGPQFGRGMLGFDAT